MKISIIEDEKVAARRLKRMIENALPDGCEISLFTTFEDALEHLQITPPDLIMLDLNLDGDDGFSILQQLPDHPFQTIVVSANTDRAIEAFELGILDFIPKPFDEERLQRALNRFTGRYNRINGATTLVIKNQGRRQFIPVTDIKYISGAGDYAELHLADGSLHLYNKSLEKITEQLPEQFVRVHKSYIVDRKEIAEVLVHGAGKYSIRLNDNTTVPLSRARYKDLFTDDQTATEDF